MSKTLASFFQHKTVLITGAASGIGDALAEQFAAFGARLALCDREAQALQKTQQRLSETYPSGDLATFEMDVASEQDWQQCLQNTYQRFGGIDVVINNAGIEGSAKPCWATDMAQLQRTMDVNFYGMAMGSKLSLPYLARQSWAALVNVSSIFGLVGVPNASDYCASKFAIRGYTESLRAELYQMLPHIQVHLVHPGGIATNIARHAHSQSFKDKFLKTQPKDLAMTIAKGIYKNTPRMVYGHQSGYAYWGAKLLPLQWLTKLANREMRSLDMFDDYIAEHPSLALPPQHSDKGGTAL